MAGDGLGELVTISRQIGQDPSLVLAGGGNTSVKLTETDPLGRKVKVLRVKSSGSDLRAIRAGDFVGVRLGEVQSLRSRPGMADAEIVEILERLRVEPGPRPSIETLLHAFLPGKFVLHTHADAALMLTNTPEPRRHVAGALGSGAALVPYRRPGFRLAKDAAAAARRARWVVLEKHGLVTWGETGWEALRETRRAVKRASEYVRKRRRAVSAPPAAPRSDGEWPFAPELRGALCARERGILHFETSPELLAFLARPGARETALRGPATPDHLMKTGIRPLWTDGSSPDALRAAVRTYEKAYEAYYRRHFRRSTEARAAGMHNPAPRLVLVPGAGVAARGKDRHAAMLAAEIFRHTLSVMEGASALGGYVTVSEADLFDVDYWPMELYKQTLAKPAGELEGRIALVTGAASGIGRAVARKLAGAGAHVAVADLDRKGAGAVASDINSRWPDRGLAVPMDVTSEESVRAGFRACVGAFGGLDIVVPNAGVALPSPVESTTLESWERSFAVNATGAFLTAREGFSILKRQGLGGAIVFVASKNVPAPGKEFGAYSASKAAGAQLARVLALEGAPAGVRVNLVHPDAVFQNSRLWSGAVKRERARAHGVPPARLGEFYRQRSLLGVEVTPEDVAEAVLWLASDRSSRTTGCAISVDGGVKEAFLR
ncbi:MAG: bifunctional rhamnulose-1-phosphate aldolase/short-chain dehydrogenase [Halobacteria archaeon]